MGLGIPGIHGVILWMDEIRSHHFETMGSHCSLAFTGESFIPGFLKWCRISSIHSIWFGLVGKADGVSWQRLDRRMCPQKRQCKRFTFQLPPPFAPPTILRASLEHAVLAKRPFWQKMRPPPARIEHSPKGPFDSWPNAPCWWEIS